MRGYNGDPPSAPYAPASSGRSRADAPAGNEYHPEDMSMSDIASMSTAPVVNAATVVPPSVLRNGNANNTNNATKTSSINSDAASISSLSRSRNHLELRSKRLASTRRISNNYKPDDASVFSQFSVVSTSAMSTVTTMSEKAVEFGMNAYDYILPPNSSTWRKTLDEKVDEASRKFNMKPTQRSRFMISVTALVVMVGMLGVVTHPYFGESPPHATGSHTRVLKDTAKTSYIGAITELSKADAVRNLGANHPDIETALSVTQTDHLDDFHQRRRRAADLPDGTVFTEPAHTRMCRTIVERLDAYDAGTTNFPEIIFTESEYVCRDPDAPYTSLMNMFAAQLLDAAGDQLGLNVDYTHRCAKWERKCTGNLTTVMFNLPDPLSVNAYAFQPGCIDAAALRTICEGSLASANPTDPTKILFPNGYLDSTTNTCNLGCYFSQVLPWIRNNLRTIATEWLDTVETRALTFWLRNAAEFSHREKDDMEVSVVSLSCAKENCDMSMANCVCEFDPLPNWVYAMHIPRSSTNVAITISPTCAKFGEGCILHAQELYHFFGQLYPRADITYNVITSSSSWYMRMITADHLVCPPGEGCLLPAIARDAYTYVYEKTSPTVSTWLTCTPQNYINRLTTPAFPPAFVQGDCRHLRARIGNWASDLALAPSMQYDTSVDGYLGCADTNYSPTVEDPYRLPTTFRWDETIWATCPVDVMTKDQFCNQMNRLGLGRVLFVGDHTTMTQAISLASVLGQNDAISTDPNVVPNFSKTIDCPNTGTGTSFELSYVRNDRLEETGTTPSPGSPNCGPNGATPTQYCYPWSTDYANYSGKQLLIVNTGYHWGNDWEAYITNFQNFVGRIDEIAAANAQRADDTIMFRTSIPGHKECELYNGAFAHYGEYCPKIVNGAFWHWWGELPPYNDYAIRIINEWNLLNTVKSGPNIELLDPWYMSVLRPDGHLSGQDAGPNCAMDPQECMLYSLPGPVDWWNHLLLMQLRDVATHLENSSPMHAWR